MKHLTAIALLLLILFVSIFTPASAHKSCHWFWSRQRVTITIERGPCYKHDFPARCKVPPQIVRGQTIDCRK